MKLTDVDLCKKIAEIEGTNVSLSVMTLGKEQIPTGRGLVDENFVQYGPFDWSLLGPLMVKYKVVVSYSFGYVSADYGINRYFYGEVSELPRAILECIVEANS